MALSLVTNDASASVAPQQTRRAIWAAGRRWVFYYVLDGGTGVCAYKTSLDGTTWSEQGVIRSPCGVSTDFVVSDDGYLYAVLTSTDRYFRRGRLNEDGTITWESEVTLPAGSGTGPVSIMLDQDGLPVIAAEAYLGGQYRLYTLKATAEDGTTWAASWTGVRASATPYTRPKLCRLLNDHCALVCVRSGTDLVGIEWDGSAWDGTDTVVFGGGAFPLWHPDAWDADFNYRGRIVVVWACSSVADGLAGDEWFGGTTRQFGNFRNTGVVMGSGSRVVAQCMRESDLFKMFYTDQAGNAYAYTAQEIGVVFTGTHVQQWPGAAVASLNTSIQPILMGSKIISSMLICRGGALYYDEQEYAWTVADPTISTVRVNAPISSSGIEILDAVLEARITLSSLINGTTAAVLRVSKTLYDELMGTSKAENVLIGMQYRVYDNIMLGGIVRRIKPDGEEYQIEVEDLFAAGMQQAYTGDLAAGTTVDNALSILWRGVTGDVVASKDYTLAGTVSIKNKRKLNIARDLLLLQDGSDPVTSGMTAMRRGSVNGLNAIDYALFQFSKGAAPLKRLSTRLDFCDPPEWVDTWEYIINDVTIKYDGGSYNEQDAASIAAYGTRSLTRFMPHITAAADAQNAAKCILSTFSEIGYMMRARIPYGHMLSGMNDQQSTGLLGNQYEIEDDETGRIYRMRVLSYEYEYPGTEIRVTFADTPIDEDGFLPSISSDVETLINSVTDLETEFDEFQGDASAHEHDASQITSGTLPAPRGGTGVSGPGVGTYLVGAGTNPMTTKTPAEVLAHIGAAASGHNHDATYSPLSHDHDADYATSTHNHDLAYSPLSHDHDADYSAADHGHDVADIITTALSVILGGTGLSSIAAGGILYASAANTLSRLAPTAANQVLRSTAPNALQFGALVADDIPNISTAKLTSGTLGVARGGTGLATIAAGSYLLGNGTGAVALKTPAEVLAHIGAAASGHAHTGTYEPADANIQTHITDTTFHLTDLEKQSLTGYTSSLLHNHSTDRNLGNATGTLDAARLPTITKTIVLTGSGGNPRLADSGCTGPNKWDRNYHTYVTLDFPKEVCVGQWDNIVLPDGLIGTTLTATFIYIATGGTGSARMGIRATCYGSGNAPIDTWGAETSADLAVTAVYTIYMSSPITLTPLNLGPGKLMHVDVLRRGTDAADTMTADLRLIAVKLEYSSTVGD